MGLPEQEWFTIGDLAHRWETSEARIELLVEAGKLQVEVREPKTTHGGLVGLFLPLVDKDEHDRQERIRADRLKPRPPSFLEGKYWQPGSKIVVVLEEVGRFESQHGIVPSYPGMGGGEQPAITLNATELPTMETVEELCDRLKLEGFDDSTIAKKVKEAFPRINPSRIGRLVTGSPSDNITVDAYRKRGEKLLK